MHLVFVYFVLSLSCLEFKTLNSNPRCFNSLPARSDVQMGQPAQAWPPIKWGVRASCLQQVFAFMLLIVTSCLSSLVDVSEFFFFLICVCLFLRGSDNSLASLWAYSCNFCVSCCLFAVAMCIGKSNLRKWFYLGLKLKGRVRHGREVMAAGLGGSWSHCLCSQEGDR